MIVGECKSHHPDDKLSASRENCARFIAITIYDESYYDRAESTPHTYRVGRFLYLDPIVPQKVVDLYNRLCG